jgi:outer membrane immunogenic protein
MRFLSKSAAAAAVGVGLLAPLPAIAGPSPAYQWSGLYGGAQVGYELGGSATADVGTPIVDQWRIGSEGAFGGLFAGYNYAFGNWVGGLEVEGNWGALNGHYYDTEYGIGPLYAQDWSAAERIRLGFLANPSTLFYGSIGLAQGGFDLSRGAWIKLRDYDGANQTLNGVQIGGGVEAFVTPNVSARVEGAYTYYGNGYAHYLGTDVYVDQTVGLDTFAARVGITYHPGWLGGSTTPVTIASVGRSWAGLYAGGQLGAIMLNDPGDYLPSSDPEYAFASKVSGEAGAYAGYNWQTGNLVAGIEVGAEFSGLVGKNALRSTSNTTGRRVSAGGSAS